MKKYFLKKNGKEVFMGDTISVTYKKDTPFGKTKTTITTKIDEDSIPVLIKYNVIEEREEKEKVEKDMDWYVESLAKRYNTSPSMVSNIIKKVLEKDPTLVLSILLKEVSRDLSETVDNAKVQQVYYISSLDGSIHSMPISKYSKYIAGFASYKDAKQAKWILKDLFTYIYGELEN